MTIKPVADLVPKARKAAEEFFANPSDMGAARRLVIMAEKLGENGVPVDAFTFNRANEARRALAGS